MASAQGHTETEIRLAVASPMERFSELAVLRPPHAGEAKRQRLVSTYFDTPARDLARRGLTLRIRRSGERRVQAIKVSARDGAANRRSEWEWPVVDDAPRLDLIAATPLADDLPADLAGRLEPLVVTDIIRTTRDVRLDGAVIEAALDDGLIEAGDIRQRVREIELELREGAPGALYRLALALHASSPVAIEVESKPARGYRLRAGDAPQSVKRQAVDLAKDVEGADAFRAIVDNTSSHLLANRAAALAADAEGIHQARVAIRRLRSALQLFAPLLEPHATTLFNNELRRVGRNIGEARDWDVFCDEVMPDAFDRAEDESAWQGLLRRAAESRRADADAACKSELNSPSFHGLALGLSAWAETGAERRALLGGGRLEARLSRQAPKLLDRLARKVERRGKAVDRRAAPAALHPLRKSLKKLRYGVEFVAALYPRQDVKRFVKRLKGLQQRLGAINDAATATRLAESLAADGHAELAAPIGELAANRERARRAAMRKLGEQWRAYRREDRFWR